MQIYIGADHGGFKLKEYLKTVLGSTHRVIDCGNAVFDSKDDFPQFAIAVAEQVVKQKGSRGILICRNGVGMSIVANRHRGVRAVLTSDPRIAKTSRTDDDTNVLCIPGDFLTPTIAKKLVDVWLATSFSGKARYRRRLVEVDRLGS